MTLPRYDLLNLEQCCFLEDPEDGVFAFDRLICPPPPPTAGQGHCWNRQMQILEMTFSAFSACFQGYLCGLIQVYLFGFLAQDMLPKRTVGRS